MVDAWRHTPEQLRQYVTVSLETGCIFWRNKHSGRPISQYKTAKGYKQFTLDGKTYLSHRVIWAVHYGEWPEGQVDHINGDRSDNALSNLRVVTASENARNRQRPDGRTGKVGVTYYPKVQKWRAQIGYEGRKISLGYFDDFKSAVQARVEAERKYGFNKNHARHAPLNPVRASSMSVF